MNRWLPAFVVTCLALSLHSESASAHGMRSAYVEIDERSPGAATMRVRTTVEAPGFEVTIDGCSTEQLPGSTLEDTGRSRSFIMHCGEALAGKSLRVAGLGPLEEVSVLARLADGTSVSTILQPGALSTELPRRQGAVDVSGKYVGLGLRHIAGGADHLLFLVLLVLQLRRWRPVLLAETAFSLSHGLAFSATALGWVRVAPAPVEACIALSLLLLALDVGKPETEVSARRTAVLALIFGVVHGLGFAGGLREAGLPSDHVVTALVGFGLGVELGQVVVVSMLLLVLHLVPPKRITRWAAQGAVTLAGSLATYWLIARVVAIFRPEIPS